ncbi:lytic murein transglycosylase [Stappia indica]|uniref:lytic murein transglycosylase n=1 Tax=Stappia indica TaxID=538381 RepID=UPI001CD2C874|nr:lytic murein transglycosylase [Stappia indica]MCA1299921.1 lytic murein transglycosylase [Stappia indica]
MRRVPLLLAAALSLLAVPVSAGPYDAGFRAFLDGTIAPAAREAGVPAAVIARELAGMTPDTSLPGLGKPGGKGTPPPVNYQAEFRAPGGYFRDSQFNGLVAKGRTLARQHAATLQRIEQRYGVPGRIVLAIWARESGYGAARIPKDALRTLATRAYMGQRRDFFAKETVAALQILADGHIRRQDMKSSWGGALGQPQFLPSSFLRHAVDFDGDGKRDIWNSAPDTLASIAAYLNWYGWVKGRDWGFEAVVPASVSCTREGPDRGQPITSWTTEGVRRVKERPFPAHERPQPGFLLMPAGRFGPAFIATDNFYVLKSYNESDVYALFVGHLADRYGTNAGFVQDWRPIKTRSRGAVRKIQLALEAKGYDVGGADGLIGFKTRRSLGAAQEKAGNPATCWLE